MATLTSTLVVKLLDQVSGPAGKVANSLLGINNAAGKATAPYFADRLQGALEANNRALATTRGKMLDAVAAGWALKTAMTAAISPAVSFESAMADVAKVTNLSDEAIGQLGKSLRNLAVSEVPMSATDLAAITAAGAQSGINDADLVDFTRMIAKVGVAWETAAAETGDSLAKIKTALGLSLPETQLYADAINSLSDETAASAPDMVEYSRRVAAAGKVAGFAATDVLTFGAAMISAGAEPEVAATSMRNFAKALTKGSAATKKQLSALKELGLSSEKLAKQMQVDAKGTALDVLSRIASAPAEKRMSLMSQVFGDEARALMPLLADLPRLKQMLAEYADETKYAGSANAEFERRSRTAEYALQRMKNATVEIAISIGDALLPVIKDMSKILVPIAQKIAGLAQRFPQLTRAVVLGTAALIGLKVALIGVQYAALLARGGLISTLLPFARVGKAAHMAATGNVALRTALAGMNGMKLTGFQKFTAGLTGLVRAIPGVGLLGAVLKGVGATVLAVFSPLGALIAGIVAALAVGGVMIWKYWSRIASVFNGVGKALVEQFPALEKFSAIGSSVSAGWSKAASTLKDFGSWIGSFFSQEVLSGEQKAGWETAGYDAAKSLIDGIKNGFTAFMSFSAEDFLTTDWIQIGRDIGASICEGIWEDIKTLFMDLPVWIAQLGEQLTNSLGSSIKGWLGFGDDKPKEPLPRPTDPALARQFDRQEEKRKEREQQRQDRKLNYKTSLAQTQEILANLQSAPGKAAIPAPAGDPAGGSAAANETMDSFNSAFDQQAAQTKSKAQQLMAELQSMLSTTLQPTIRPKIDMSGISGVHADVGVE